jgi:signal transduction histidine kinase
MPTRIVVADTGSGIPADQVPLIFDRFSTGADGLPRGTGLGLPLVRAVARAHGGNVTVSSQAGRGSAFELTLPVPAGERLALSAGADIPAVADVVDQERIADIEEEGARR